MSTVAVFFNPAKKACLPNIVDERNLLAANSLFTTTEGIMRLLGPSVGGALVGLLGVKATLFLDAGSFFISAITILGIALPSRTTAVHPINVITIYQDLLKGLNIVARNPRILSVFVLWLMLMLGSGAMNASYVIFITKALGMPAAAYGAVMTAQGLGIIIGGIVAGNFLANAPPSKLLLLAQFLSGLFIVFVANSLSFPLVLALTVLIGIGAAIQSTTSETILQTEASEEFRGRIFGTFGAAISVANLISMGIAGLLGELFRIRAIFTSAGLIILLGPVIVSATQRLRQKRVSAPKHPAEQGLP